MDTAMDNFFKWKSDKGIPQLNKCRELIERLEAARNKLPPIIDDIFQAAEDGDQFIPRSLSARQSRDVIWASQILKEIKYRSTTDPRTNEWPSTDVIVNNISEDLNSRPNSRTKSIIIDESEMVSLLELYEQMGEIIHKMEEKTIIQPDHRDSIKKEKSTSFTEGLPGISEELNEDQKHEYESQNDNVKGEEGTNIILKIQCISDPCEGENSDHKESTIHCQLKLGGEPVTVKISQANPECCVNTEVNEKENNIKIVTKKCPQCFSGVIGPIVKVKQMRTESPEAVILHGNAAQDEIQMPFSSDESDSY